MMGTYIEKLKDFERKINREKKGITITVSGLSGSGKSTVGESIAKSLGLKAVSMGDIFRELASEKGVSIEEFSRTRDEESDIMLDKKTLELAKEGGVVLIGRLTAWVAGDNADVKIWVDCDDNVRFERVARREGISPEEARKRILERDNADAVRYGELYGIDLSDKSIYDILFDNTSATYDEATTEPLKAVRELLNISEA